MNDTYAQGCPIAVALDIIGDRWTMLLLRDLAHAPMRFTDLQQINPKISPNLLTARLRTLEGAGIVRRRRLPPPAASVIYELEDNRRDQLLPILNALGRFGADVATNAPPAPLGALLAQMRRNGTWILAKGIAFAATFQMRVDRHDLTLEITPTTFHVSDNPPINPDATITSNSATLIRLFNAGITLESAEHTKALRIDGDRDLALTLLKKMSLGPLELPEPIDEFESSN